MCNINNLVSFEGFAEVLWTLQSKAYMGRLVTSASPWQLWFLASISPITLAG